MSAPLEYTLFKLSILKRSFVIVSSVFVVALLLGQRELAAGFLLGGAISALNFLQLSRYILAMREAPIKRARWFITSKFLILYAVMALALLIGMKKGLGAFFGVALGLMVVRLAIFLEVFKRGG